MLKPFYNKKKNIDDRLVPAVTAADAGKVLGVTEEGKIGLVDGGSDFSPIRGKLIQLTVTNNVITEVEVDQVSINPSDFFAMPDVVIVLALSQITIIGLTIDGHLAPVSYAGAGCYYSNGDIVVSGLFTYSTPDGSGLGDGNFRIGEDLEVNFDMTIFVTP